MSTNKERHEALLRVVEFAKSQGFTRADTAFWHDDCPESGNPDLNESLLDYDPGNYKLGVGVYLNETIEYTKTAVPEDEDNEVDEYETIEPTEGEAP